MDRTGPVGGYMRWVIRSVITYLHLYTAYIVGFSTATKDFWLWVFFLCVRLGIDEYISVWLEVLERRYKVERIRHESSHLIFKECNS